MVGFYEVQVRDRACGERFRINSFLFTMATTLDTSCIVNSDAPIELTKSCLPNFHVAPCILFKHFQVPGIICKVIVIPKTCVGTAIIWGIEMGCYKSQFFPHTWFIFENISMLRMSMSVSTRVIIMYASRNMVTWHGDIYQSSSTLSTLSQPYRKYNCSSDWLIFLYYLWLSSSKSQYKTFLLFLFVIQEFAPSTHSGKPGNLTGIIVFAIAYHASQKHTTPQVSNCHATYHVTLLGHTVFRLGEIVNRWMSNFELSYF